MTRLLRRFLLVTQIVFAISTIAATSKAQDRGDAKNSPAIISGTVSMRDSGSLPKTRILVGRISGGAPRQQIVHIDGSGHFETEPLEAGLYAVSISAPGYITEPQAPNTASWYRPGDTASFTLTKGGVITGTIKNPNGEPVVAIPVRATMVKNRDGKPLQFTAAFRTRVTDDRGMYRLYGLPPGTYVVSAGGPARAGFILSSAFFETYVPTYAPSATRDTASEVVVNSGDEVTADIQFREERGHILSGTIAGGRSIEGSAQPYAVSVSLFDARNHFEAGNATAISTNYSFSINGVPDGEYELYASQGSETGESIMSPGKMIKVQGADISGINLTLALGGSITGRVVLENDPKAPCGKRKPDAMNETMVYARRFEPEQKPKDAPGSDVPYIFKNSVRPAMLDGKGNFEIKNLQPGSYRIDPREPASGWFLKSITAGAAPRPLSIASDGLTVKSGERASNITITISEGASQLLGKVTLAEGQSLAANTRVYLVPAEREAAENLLRFHEARPDASGKFTIDYIAPGNYFIIARAAEENEYGIAKSARFDPAFRHTVLQSATAAKKEVSFKPCEKTFDYPLPLTTSTSPQ